jgi:hypothetical protein
MRLPRPLWIGLAAIVLIMTAAGLGVGIPIYRQQIAVREIEELGGWVFTAPRTPEWLYELLFRIDEDLGERSDVVVSVCLDQKPATDSTLYRLSSLTDLKELRLNGTQVTDGGLKHLQALSKLERLSLNSTRVTDTGVAALQRALPALKIDR